MLIFSLFCLFPTEPSADLVEAISEDDPAAKKPKKTKDTTKGNKSAATNMAMLKQLDQSSPTALGVTKNSKKMGAVVTTGVRTEEETPSAHDIQNVESGTSAEPPAGFDVSREETAQADSGETISSGSDTSSGDESTDDDHGEASELIAAPDNDRRKKAKANSQIQQQYI